MPYELRALAFRIVATTLVALALLLVSPLRPGKPTAALAPIETTISADENGREHAPSFDMVIEPSRGPAVGAMFATQHLSTPTLAPNIRRPTRGVLRL